MRKAKLYQLLAVAGGLGVAVATTPVLAGDSVTVNVNDDKDSAYQVSVTNDGNSWTYTIAQTNGKELSHWDLSLGNCLDHVESTDGGEILSSDPSKASPGEGADPSVKSSPLIKWDTKGGTFTITLDDTYPAGTVSVLAKTGTMYGTGTITGPDCSTPVVEVEDPLACNDLVGANGVSMSVIATYKADGNGGYSKDSGTGNITIDADGNPSVDGGTVDIATFIEDGVQDSDGIVSGNIIQFCQVPVFDSEGAEVCLWTADKDADGNYVNIEQVGCVDAEKGKFYAIEAAGEFSNALKAE
jgi:hypothetical protein